jgi:hypothetical protein
MFSPTAPDYIVKLRETLLRHGTFVDEHDRYTLAQDCTFASRSSSPSVVGTAGQRQNRVERRKRQNA